MKYRFFTRKAETVTLIAPRISLLKKLVGALFLVQRTDRKEYRKIFGRLHVIFVTEKKGYTNEFFMPERIWFANQSLIEDSDVAWLASLILHEAFHATQFKKGKYVLPLAKLEPPALALQMKFLKKLGDRKGSGEVEEAKRERYWTKMRKDKISARHFRTLLRLFSQDKLILKGAE